MKEIQNFRDNAFEIIDFNKAFVNERIATKWVYSTVSGKPLQACAIGKLHNRQTTIEKRDRHKENVYIKLHFNGQKVPIINKMKTHKKYVLQKSDRSMSK